jgi:hypothetical protein
MLSVRRLVEMVGNPIRAEVVLLEHYAAKQRVRRQWDRRYAAMDFVLRWAPLFRRHLATGCK